MPFRILSIDGGGIRGIIPAVVLAHLEALLGRPVARSFDLIAGTSTGGILGLALTQPGADGGAAHRAEELVEMYRADGPRIFARDSLHRIRALGNLVEEKYPQEGIEDVLEERFGAARLSEALTDVMVTAYDIEQRQPYFFKSHRARTDPLRDHLMRDAARATSAAPTYFEPAAVPLDTPRGRRALVDGGVYANNPAACALVEAVADFGAHPAEIVLLSLGTGILTRSLPLDAVRGWGLAQWAQPLLDVVFDGVSDTVDYQMQALLGAGGASRYLRLQPVLADDQVAMDDAGADNLDELLAQARRLVTAQSAALDRFAALLDDDGPDPSPPPGGGEEPGAHPGSG